MTDIEVTDEVMSVWNEPEWLFANKTPRGVEKGPYKVTAFEPDPDLEKPGMLYLKNGVEVFKVSEWNLRIPKGARVDQLIGRQIKLVGNGSRFKIKPQA